MKRLFKALAVAFTLLIISTNVYAMGFFPGPPEPQQGPAPEEISELGTDLLNFSLLSFGDSLEGDIDILALLSSFGETGFIELGEHNGTTVSMAPCLSGGIVGLTIRLTFDNAVVEVPVDPADPSGEKEIVATIDSGVLDISAGYGLENLFKNMIVIKLNTEETLVLADANNTEIEFEDLKMGFSIESSSPVSDEIFSIEGKMIVDGYEIDMETIAALIELMSSLSS